MKNVMIYRCQTKPVLTSLSAIANSCKRMEIIFCSPVETECDWWEYFNSIPSHFTQPALFRAAETPHLFYCMFMDHPFNSKLRVVTKVLEDFTRCLFCRHCELMFLNRELCIHAHSSCFIALGLLILCFMNLYFEVLRRWSEKWKVLSYLWSEKNVVDLCSKSHKQLQKLLKKERTYFICF
jgi:hypothetical protein